MHIYVNGLPVKTNLDRFEATLAHGVSAYIDGDVSMNKGDTLEIRIFQNSGGPESFITTSEYNTLSIARIK